MPPRPPWTGTIAFGLVTVPVQQHLGALRVVDGLIVLEQLRFADEQQPVEGIKPAGQPVSRQELDLAATLIESYRGPWRPEKHGDTYRAELCALIEAKRKGKAPAAAAKVEEEQPTDLMEALRTSIQASGPARSRRRSTRGRSPRTARRTGARTSR